MTSHKTIIYGLNNYENGEGFQSMDKEATMKQLMVTGIQRIENTTSNGVPDIMAITPTMYFLLKVNLKRVRPEQAAFQIEVNETTAGLDHPCICVTSLDIQTQETGCKHI